MNYLGHAYLSFEQTPILVGNMVSDFVKGRARFDFPEDIQKGIMLHREIDNFTDFHPAVKEAKLVFKTDYGLYSGPLVDVIFDHYLALDAESFPPQQLLPFTQSVYSQLDSQQAHLPERFAFMFTYMKAENWLHSYANRSGIERSLRGLVRRSRYMTESETAFRLFNSHYTLLQQLASAFLPDVKSFAKDALNAR
ncbi:MAG: ACP phosphodiesterase [Flavisolibacter sp.]